MSKKLLTFTFNSLLSTFLVDPPHTILVDFSACKPGEVSERFKEHAWKACVWGNLHRGFESLSLRYKQVSSD